MNKNQPIGVFDSGIGGLTVLKEIRELLPAEDLIYLGDTARVPYGTKSPETVAKYSIRNALFLLEQGVKALVIACNTASAHGLDPLKRHFRVPVLGVIEPGAQTALGHTQTKKIGVIGTQGTIQSRAYQLALETLDPSVAIVAKACPLLVSLAEEGWTQGPVVDLVLKTYLEPLLKEPGLDTLILGCTHYPLFKSAIQSVLGPNITLVDSAKETALSLKRALDSLNLLREQGVGQETLYSTDAPDRMKQMGHLFLGHDLGAVHKVDIASF